MNIAIIQISKTFPLLLLFIFLNYCCKMDNENDYPINSELIEKIRKSNKFDDIFKLNKIIEINYTDSTLIGEITDMKVDKNGNIYIVDGLKMCFWIINGEGKILKKVGKRGEGQNEFLGPNCVDVDENSIVIGDDRLKRIKIFDLSGKYLKDFKVNTSIGHIYVNNKKEIYIEYLSLTNVIDKYNYEGSLVNSFGNCPDILKNIGYPVKWANITHDKYSNIYYVHVSEYKISKYDGDGNIIKTIIGSPSYYKPLKKAPVNHEKEEYDKWCISWNPIYSLNALECNLLLLQIRIDQLDFKEYNNYIEILNLNGNIINGEIKNNMQLLCTDRNDILYFYNPFSVEENKNPKIYLYSIN
jgi:hypothetical protein